VVISDTTKKNIMKLEDAVVDKASGDGRSINQPISNSGREELKTRLL
jgi:hypothetical protein